MSVSELSLNSRRYSCASQPWDGSETARRTRADVKPKRVGKLFCRPNEGWVMGEVVAQALGGPSYPA
jgi:hypothetical protein